MFLRVNSQYYAHMKQIHSGERYKCWDKNCEMQFDDIRERDLHQGMFGFPLMLETIPF